jgi:hypothetical protein
VTGSRCRGLSRGLCKTERNAGRNAERAGVCWHRSCTQLIDRLLPCCNRLLTHLALDADRRPLHGLFA